MRERTRLRLLEATDPAAVALIQQLDATDPQVVIRAATAILDRAGVGRAERIDLGGHVQVEAHQIVQVLVSVFAQLGVEVDDHVRHVVGQELRAMSPSSRPQLRPVQ